MRTTILQLLTATAVLAAPVAAHAGHVSFYDPLSKAFVSTNGGGGIGIANGVQDTYYGTVGVVGTSQGGWQNSASTQSLGNSAASSANLVDGSMHAFAQTGTAAYNTAAFADARLADTLWFTNTTGSAIALDVRFSLDGTITNMSPPYGGYASFALTSCGGCGNVAGEKISYGNGTEAHGTQYLLFDPTGVIAFAEDTGASGPSPNYTYGSSFDAGYMTGFYETTLYIPTGLTTLGFTGALYLDCRGPSATCDFGNTGKVALGPLADGLSYTSASGVFLTADNGAPVPEPASWALMIAGFGLAGAALRRRRAVVA